MRDTHNKESSSTFVRGALILGITGVIIKVIGAFFRIPLGNLIGPEAMSYYQSAYPIYIFFIALATTGFPSALGRMVSERKATKDYNNLNRTVQTAMVLMLGIGAFGTLVMFFGAGWIANAFNNPEAVYSFRALAPAVVIVTALAIYRGFFQGVQNMKPFATSQLIEQLGRVFFGYFLAYILLKKGLPFAAAGATFGSTAGAFLGLLAIYWMYRLFRASNPKYFTYNPALPVSSRKAIAGELFRIAIPISLGAAVMPLMGLIDVSIVMNRLADIGYGAQAKTLYGLLSGYVMTLINLPQAITAAIQISIVPAVASCFVKREFKALGRTVESGIRMALVIGMPAAVGYMVLAEPIINLLYPKLTETGTVAASILAVFSSGVIFLGLFQVTTGILQGMNLQMKPAFNLLIGATVKVVLTYILVGIPSIHVRGAAFSSVIAYSVAAILNILTLKRHADVELKASHVVFKPLASSAVMGIVVFGVFRGLHVFMSSNKATLLSILVGVAVYGYMLLATRTLTDEDLSMMPGGRYMKRLRDKLESKKLIPKRIDRR